MSQTVVTVDVGGTGANNANAALTNLGALPTFGGSISGNLNVASSLVVTGNANLGNYVVSGNSISTTQTNGDVVLTPKGTGRLRVRSKILSGNGAEAHFSSSGIDESSIGIGSFNDSNGAAELLIVNKNSGTLAYSEMIAINDTGDQDQGWISVGVNSSGYDDPEYTLTGPDDGYVLFEAPQGTSANGDLIIGTGSFGLNNKIVMAAGGFTPTDAQLVIMPADLKRANLTSYVVAANVVTFTTDTTHTFVANDIVAISDVGAPYDGTRTITDVSSNTFNVSVTVGNVGPINLSPAGFALQFLPFNKGTVELTAQLFVGENSRSTIETADITLAEGHAIPLGIVVDNDGPGQTVMFNKSNGVLSYSEFIAHNDAGNVEHGWISVGINSSGYDDPEFPITKADDGYLLFEPPEGTSGDGDLIIGTGTNGQKNRLIFAAEGFDEANAQMIITPNESVRISIPTDASSANTGALQVVGGVGVQGSMYVQGNQTIQGDLIVNGSQVIQSIENLAAAGPISLLSDGNIANTWDQGIVGTYAVSKTSNTHSVTFKAIANNTGTLTTANNHGFVAEDYVTVANVDVTFNGTHRITAATSNTISFFLLANNLSITAATGDATVDKAARYTGLVKRATDGNWRFFSGLGTRPAFNTDFTDANLAFDSIIAGSADFRGSLKLGSPNTATIVYTDNNARTFTIPAVGGNRTFAFIDQAQTFTAAQSFNNTVTATKFTPTAGDATGNGLYLSDTNKLGLTADGVERVSIGASETVINDGSADYDFRVESDGNANMLFVDGGNNRVGIGTGAPGYKFHVEGSGTAHEIVGWFNNQGAYASRVAIRHSNKTAYVSNHRSNDEAAYDGQLDDAISFGTASSASPIQFYNGNGGAGGKGTARITITSGGNVGIGITDPLSKLHVNQGYIISGTSGSTGGAKTLAIPYGDGHLATLGSEYSTGAMMIGYGVWANTTVNETFTSSSGIAMQRGAYVAAGDHRWYTGVGQTVVANTNVAITERMRISNAGNVGIGTTNPGYKLHVEGGAYFSSSVTSNDLTLSVTRTSGTNTTALTLSDNVTGLQTSGFGTQIRGVSNGGAAISAIGFEAFGGTNNDTGISFYTQAIAGGLTRRMIVDSTGRVGIGTASPSYKLHVVDGAAAIQDTNSIILTPNYGGTTGIPAGALINSGNAANVTFIADATSGTANRGVNISAFSGSNWFRGLSYMNKSGTPDLILQQDGGNVGIGTTTPTGKLTVASAAGEVHRSIELIQAGGDTTALKVGFARFGSLDGSYYADMLNNSWWDGSTWIADNASYAGMLFRLDNATTVGNAAYRWYISAPGATHNYVEYMTLTTTGLLLGTSGTPGYKLDVRGSGTVAGFISSTSTVGITIEHSGNGGTIGYTNNGAGDLANLFYITTGAATVGSGIVMDNSGRVGIATANPGSYRLYVQGDQYVSGTLTEGSSITLKENIDPITNALDLVTKLVGVTYDRKDGSGKNRAGLIAEEVDQILPNVVKKDENGNASGIQYTNLIAYLVESIKELKAEIDVLKSK